MLEKFGRKYTLLVDTIDDRTMNHTDASASVEFHGLSKIVRDLKAVSKALKYKPDELDDIELTQRNKLRID